jgi:sorting nexin-1/2
MAEYREEPPPMLDNEKNDKEDDDLFTSASESKPSPMERSAEKDNDIFTEACEELSLETPPDEQKRPVSDWTTSPVMTEVNNDKLQDDFPKLSVTTETSSSSTAVTSSAAKPNPTAGASAAAIPVAKPRATLQPAPESKYNIQIFVKDPKKIGDGISAYLAYKVITKTNIPDFRNAEMEVYRRFSDFLGLHEKLVEKHLHHGCIIPPPPEKSVVGMTKMKMSKDDPGSTEFVEQRRAALERFVNCIAKHPVLQTDPSFVDFLEVDGDLPRATSTSALSGAGVMRLFSRVGDSLGKMAYKMDENDQWFEEKQQHIEMLDTHLRKLHASLETLITHRKDVAQSTGLLANGIALLGSAEENTTLARALAQLADVEEKVDIVHVDQADADYFIFAELVHEYVGLVQAIKEVFHERVKAYKTWKDDEVMLAKKRETKARLELAHKTDKISAASHEITEWEHRVEKSQEEFESISKSIRKEVERFEVQRYNDFKATIISYLETLMQNQQQLIKYWETFIPEAKAIA